jgi:adenylosuccinate synthase
MPLVHTKKPGKGVESTLYAAGVRIFGSWRGVLTAAGISSIRAYMTRHGPGPFVTEDPVLTRRLPDLHNGTNPWQRKFRVGWLDLVMLRYALAVTGGVDEIAITCLDRLPDLPTLRICERYEGPASTCFQDGALRIRPAPNLSYQE